MPELDHNRLCDIAVAWLQRPYSRKGPGCQVAIRESRNYQSAEIPDAIGWRAQGPSSSYSVLVEAKVSRADFLADAKKPHRLQSQLGMGTFRYFIAPTGLIEVAELPAKWGLIEVLPSGSLKIRAGHVLERQGQYQDWEHASANMQAELCTLTMVLARVGDPQKFQDLLRQSDRRNSRLLREVEQLRLEINQLHKAKNKLWAELHHAKQENDELPEGPRQ